jgi:putative N6-adenine-specific DNA methylase
VMDINLFNSTSKIVITCPKRMSVWLKAELLDLGYFNLEESHMSVSLQGTLQDCMKLNLFLRTGHSILFQVKEFYAKTPEDLYKEMVAIPWEEYIDVNGYFSVTSFSDNPEILDSRFPNLKCKDAIADRITSKKGSRPNSGSDRNKTVINLHWRDDRAAIYIDTSGETIAKHGYRKIPFKAPLQESLAAALILASKWDKHSNFINPMCGSGTLAIEAALIAQNRAPGLLRSNFGFMHILGFDLQPWEEMRREARLSSKKIDFKIIATDLNEDAIQAAQRNAATAGVDHVIEFICCDFRETPIPEGGGVVMINPEYGERLGEVDELRVLYKEIGDFFKKSCSGYTGYVFTGNLDLGKQVGLKPKRKIEFYNSKIDCRLLEFELYSGTKKVQPEIN